MKYNPLGASGLLVSELCLGTMIFGEDSQRSTSAEIATHIIHRFLDAGGNHIDTANVYANGRSEEIVGKAIRGKREQVVLATKVRFSMGSGPNDTGLSRVHIQNSVEASLKRLQTDVIDLLYMHCFDPITPIEESMQVFDDLVRSGKVRYVGVSNFKAWQMMKALGLSDHHGWARFIAAQYQYSLVERNIEPEIRDLCFSEGVGIVPWGALGGGFLSGKYHRNRRPISPDEGRIAVMESDTEESWQNRDIDRNWEIIDIMDEIIMSYAGASHSRIALRWVLSQPGVDSAIIGVRTPEQLEDNLKTLELNLADDELQRLSEVSALKPVYPYGFMEKYGTR